MMPGMFPAGAAKSAAASFPVVQGTNQGGTTGIGGTANPFNVPLPASIQSGDLLLIFVATNATTTLTTPSGWTQRFNTASGVLRFACYYKVASGSEGSTVAVTASGACSWATNSYRISNYQGTPESGTTATGSSANPDPPSLGPSWGSAKTLWIAASADLAFSATTPTPPTNYTNQLVYSHAAFGFNTLRTATARRELEASSENPGTFVLGGSEAWIANTVAVRPA